MRYIQTYENYEKISKDNLIRLINQIIDDAMLPILDEGFKQESAKNIGYFDLYRMYKRVNLNGEGKADIVGYVDEDGNIKYNGRCQDELKPILEEIENSMRIISGLSGLDFSFTFINRCGQDNLILEIKI